MDALVSKALMIRLSLHPSPASEMSAFNRMRAFNKRFAGLFRTRGKFPGEWGSQGFENMIQAGDDNWHP